MTTSMTALWESYKRALESLGVGAVRKLQPGASPEAIARLQGLIERPLPRDLIDLLVANDGDGGAPGVLFGAELLSVAVIEREWTFDRSLAPADRAALDADCVSIEPGVVHAQYTHPGWIPFLTEGDGRFFAVDLAPGPRGKAGQIINVGKGESRKTALAASLRDLLERAVADLAAGRYVLEPDPFDFDESGPPCIRCAPDLPYLDAAKRAAGLAD